MSRHLSFSFFIFFSLVCKPSFSTRLIASFTFEQWCQQLIHCASSLTTIAVFEHSITSKTDLCISTFSCRLVLKEGGRFANFHNMRTLSKFFWLATWPGILLFTQRGAKNAPTNLCNNLVNCVPFNEGQDIFITVTPEEALFFLFLVWEAVLSLENGGTLGCFQPHWTLIELVENRPYLC